MQASSISVIGAVAGLLCAGCAAERTGARPGATTVADPLRDVAFLAGTWRTPEADGVWTEECWTAPAGGSMLGVSRTIGRDPDRTEKLRFFEYLRVSRDENGVVYYAAPMGRSPATAFRMVTTDDGKVVFENPEHDFPTRLMYWMEAGGRLHARIEGREAGRERAEDWIYDRAQTDQSRVPVPGERPR
jgi:hypothetical protein